jgi:hypothetical protein
MRKSFVTAAWAWLAVIVFDQFTREIFVILPVGILATVFTILWIAHIATFVVRQSATSAFLVAPAKRRAEGEIMDRGRRTVLPLFAKALVASVAIAALPIVGRARNAADQDSGDKCRETCDSEKETCISGCGDEPPGGGDPQTPEEAERWERWERCQERCRREGRSCKDGCQ